MPHYSLYGSPALQRPRSIDGDTTQTSEEPSAQRIDEELMFGDIIKGSWRSNPKKRDIFPTLVLGQEYEGAFARNVRKPLLFHLEEGI
jgi:hypothetical protein